MTISFVAALAGGLMGRGEKFLGPGSTNIDNNWNASFMKPVNGLRREIRGANMMRK